MLPQIRENQRKTLINRLIQSGESFSLRRAADMIDEWEQEDAVSGYPSMYRGILAVLKHDFETALSHFNEAIKKNPSTAIFWKNKAVPLMRLSRYQDALASIRRAHLLSVTTAEQLSCLQMLGGLLLEIGEDFEAEHIFRKIVHMGYRSDGLFIALWLQGRYEEAMEALLAFVDLSPYLDGNVFIDPPPGSESILFDELLQHLLELLQEGYSPDLILQALDLPPQDIEPGTREHLNWWKELTKDENWLKDVRETLHILSVPGWKERILAAKAEPSEERVGLGELGW